MNRIVSVSDNDWVIKELESKTQKTDCKGHVSRIETQMNSISQDLFLNSTSVCYLFLQKSVINSIERNLFSSLKGLRYINLSENKLDIISSELLTYNTKLFAVDISNNKIRVVKKDAFRYLSQLAWLDLSHNRIQVLDDSLFMNNTKLLRLFLSNNEISSVSDNLFAKLFKLDMLHFDNNKIQGINASLFKKNYKLQLIRLNNNNIHFINESTFLNLNILTSLHLQNNYINEVNWTVGKLNFLDLSFNKINKLSEHSFSKMPLLRILHLVDNCIEIIHPKQFQFNNALIDLHLINNSISELPTGVLKNLADLNYFSINKNKLEKVSGELFAQNIDLRRLAMSLNKITHINASAFASLHKLSVLSMHSNEILVIDKDLFRNNSKLKVLDLSRNNISQIVAGTFDHLIDLKKINLSHNLLTSFEGALGGDNLSEAYLNNNKLKDLTKIDFSAVPELNYLNLEFNEIESTPANLFQYNTNLRLFNISNNKITKFEYSIFKLKASNSYMNLISGDFRNNKILEVETKTDHRFITMHHKMSIYLWESEIVGHNVNWLKSVKFFGSHPNLKIEQFDLSIDAQHVDIVNITCSHRMIIVNLNLRKNNLSLLECLSHMWTLHYLDVSDNQFQSLSRKQFSRLIHLERLNISHNRIVSLNPDIFNVSVGLKEFYTSKTEMRMSWDYYKITELFPHLTNVSIQNNKIYCPLLSTILMKFKKINITICNHQISERIVFDSVDGIYCESYQSIKNMFTQTTNALIYVTLLIIGFYCLLINCRYLKYRIMN